MKSRNLVDIIERFQTRHALRKERELNNFYGPIDWDVSFWFAVLSPVFGILAGLLAAFLIYH